MKRGIMTKAQMREPSRSAVRFMFHPTTNPFQNLANAIVATAADDYRLALKEENTALKEDLESFFYSKWYKALTKIDPDKLLSAIVMERNNELRAIFA